MKSLVQGVGYARQMRKNPGFKAMAGLILATHIGSTKVIFRHMSALMLQPLLEQRPRELVPLCSGRPGVDMGFPSDNSELFSFCSNGKRERTPVSQRAKFAE